MITNKESIDAVNKENEKLLYKTKKELEDLRKAYDIAIGEINKYLKLKKKVSEEINILKEIDLIIEQCKSSKPVPFEQSKFNRLYNKLKEKYV